MRDQHMMTSRLDSRFCRLSARCRRQQYQLRFQQRQHRRLLPDRLRGLHPQRSELQERQSLLRRGQRAAMVRRIQHGESISRDGFAKNPHMHLFVGMGYYDFACPFYPVEWTHRPPEGFRRSQEEQHFDRLLRSRSHGLHRSARGREIPRRSGEIRARCASKMTGRL